MLALGLSAAALYCLPLMGLEDSRDGIGSWQLTEVQVIHSHNAFIQNYTELYRNYL